MLRKQFQDTQRVTFMFNKTRQSLFRQLATKKKHFFERNLRFFPLKCRIVPKNVKGGPFGIY